MLSRLKGPLGDFVLESNMKFLLILFSVLSMQMAVAEDSPPPVTTVTSVDLNQYLGTWYEIAAIPQFFERKCVGNTTAEYRLAENDLISVLNTCDRSNGKASIAHGRAEVVDHTSNAKLKVTFVHFLGWQFALGGDYWILALGDHYSYAVVGSPNRKYAWVLSRTPEMPADLLAEARLALTNQGFDTCKLISTPQKGGLQEKTQLCKLETGK